MAQSLGPVDIYCDSPPYPIVQACNRIGLQRPEDVRWCRMSHFLSGHDGRGEVIGMMAWKSLLGIGRPRELTCDCGHPLPTLERCTFTFITGREASYMIGQCSRCLTVFWEDS